MKPSAEEILAAIKALGSDDFFERENAAKQLWLMGRDAEQPLREAVAASEPGTESSYRAKRILDEFDLGLYPDTPEELRRLVELYRSGDERTRAQAINQLAAEGHIDLLAKLISREQNPALREELAAVVGENARRQAPAKIADGDFDAADDLLRTAALASSGMRDYAAFLVATGRAADAIDAQRTRADNSAADRELLAWMLRAEGRFDEAAEAYRAAGRPEFARATHAAGGDLLALAELAAEGRDRGIALLAPQLAAARLGGAAEEEIDRIVGDIEDYAAAVPDDATACIAALCLNGRGAEGIALAARFAPEDALDLALARYDFDTAARAAGLESAEPEALDAWLRSFLDTFSVRRETMVADAVEPARIVLSFLAETGQREASARVLDTVARRLTEDGYSPSLISSFALQMGHIDLALEIAVRAMETDTEFQVVQDLFGRTATPLWTEIRASKPGQSYEASLRELGAALGIEGFGDGDLSAVITAMRSRAAEAPQEEKLNLYRQAAALALEANLFKLAAQSFQDALAADADGAQGWSWFLHYQLATALSAEGRHAEAIEHYDLALEGNANSPDLLYLKAHALSQAGDAGQADALRQRAAAMALGDISDIRSLARNAAFKDDPAFERAALLLVTRLADVTDESEAVEHYAASARLAGVEASARRFGPAADATESAAVALVGLIGSHEGPTSSLAYSYAAQVGKSRARALLDAGRYDAAVALLRSLAETNPADSSLLEDAYQLLADNGRGEAAEALFATVHTRCRTAVERFPEHAEHNNNIAWLLSRCGRELDTALAHAEKAVAIEPDNGAYLDTLAEVHFQRGDRDKAVEFSQRAVELLGSDPMVRAQLERFKNGEPSDR